MDNKIEEFLKGKTFAVVGASTNREKYGNKVLRCYIQNNLEVFPINPRAEQIEGLKCYPDLASLPKKVDAVSIIIPPKLGVNVVEEANKLGIKHLWFQPGAQSDDSLELASRYGISAIGDGSCLLVILGYTEK